MEIYTEILISIFKLLVINYALVDLTNFVSELIPTPKNKYFGVPILIFKYWGSCPKCSSFWITILLTGDLFTAALIALLINSLKELEYKYKKTEL